MKLSTKVRYAVRAMTELAMADGDKYVPLRHIAEKQGLSMKYLEQMAAQLKIAGLVQSVRGAEGGYRLARPADAISVWDIYRVLDVSTELVDCRSTNCADRPSVCSRSGRCAAQEVWHEISGSVRKIMESRSLQQLAERELSLIENL